jgi:hypothetical protein
MPLFSLPRTGNWKEIQRPRAQHIFSLEESQTGTRTRGPVNRLLLIILSSPSHERALAAYAPGNFSMDELGFASSLHSDEQPLGRCPQNAVPYQETTAGQKLYSHNALLSRFDPEIRRHHHSLTWPLASIQATDFISHPRRRPGRERLFLGETGAAPEELNSEVTSTPSTQSRKRKKTRHLQKQRVTLSSHKYPHTDHTASIMKLIIGLRNPGKQYRETRHNAGFQALDFLSVHFGFEKFPSGKPLSGQALHWDTRGREVSPRQTRYFYESIRHECALVA